MSDRIVRREALRRLAVFSAAAAVPGFLAACSKKKASCTDTSGLTPDELTMRNSTAAYVDQSPYPDKKCSGCVQYVPAAPDQCGTCKVVKGPINPEGYCKLYVAKPA